MPVFKHYKYEEMAHTCWARFLADRPTHIAIDTETSGLTWQDEPFGMTVAWRRPSGDIETGWLELENPVGLQRAREIINVHSGSFDVDEPRGMFIFFNAKFDIRMLTNYGLWHAHVLYDYIDVMPMVALLEPIGEHKLKKALTKYLKIPNTEEARLERVVKKLKLTKKMGFKVFPREHVVPYARQDAAGTLLLHDKLRPMVTERGLDVPFDKEMRLVEVLLNMERRGLLTVPDRAKDAIKLCDEKIAAARAEVERLTGRKVGKSTKKVRVERGLSTNPKTPDRMLYKTIEVPDDFNPGAWQQVIEVFKERGSIISSTTSAVLEKVDDPLVAPLLELRSEEKLRGTYLLPLLKEADENGIIHPSFNSFGTGTGRFSSGAVR